MLDLPTANPRPEQVVCSVAEGLALLAEADKLGLIDPKEASDLRRAAGLGLVPDKDMPDRMNRAFASGDAAERALAALDPLFRQGDVVELRALDPAGGGLSYCGRLDEPEERAAMAAFVQAHNGLRNLYVGVNPRRPDMAGTTRPASAGDVLARRSIVLDLDFKDAPPTDPDWSRTVDGLRDELDRALVVETGNGVHVWLPVQPLTGPDVAASTAPLAAAMARLGADNIADPGRVARLIGTINLPNASKRARGNVPRLALPCEGGAPLPFKPRPPVPTVAALAAALGGIATRLSLPGRGRAVTSSGRASQPLTGGEKTPHAAPSADLLRQALAELPNLPSGTFDDRGAWVDVAHSVKGAAVAGGIEAEGREAFVAWSQQWGGDPDEPSRVWDGITHPHTGWGWLMTRLRAVNPAGADRVKTAEASAAFAAVAAQNRAAIAGAPFAPVAPLVPAQIPPRRWLYGRTAIAGFLSFLVAPGGAGKSALAMVEAVAMATGRELLPGEKPVGAMRVWVHNAEDDLHEMQRRLAATLKHYGLTHSDLNGNLYLTSGRDLKLQLARTGRDGPEIVPGVVDALIERLLDAKIDVLILDPLGAVNTLPENSNEAANLLLGALREIAHRADVGLVVLHHAGKAAAMDMDAAGAGASRGASAFVDGARVVRQIVRMTEREAARFGITERDRRDYLRVENGKANLARAENARWLHMVDVPLGNGAGLWPLGDRVGVVEGWTPPDPTSGTATELARVQVAISAATQPPRLSPKSSGWVGYLVAQVLGLNIGPAGASQKDRTAQEAAAYARVRALADGWVRDGYLVVAKGRDPQTRHEVDLVSVGKPADLGLDVDTGPLLNAPESDAENAPGE